MKKLLIYGANGYTAGLIIRFSDNYGIKPIIAGRNAEKIEAIAKEYELEYKVFDLSDLDVIENALSDIDVVLHCAGPFMYTAKNMMTACINTKTHYLDITGEITVFERGARMGEAAKEAGIMLMPGTGFDVVPTDCMAAYLKEQMPDATHLELAFGATKTGLSHGTAKTMVENLGESGAIRKEGKITRVPIAYKTRKIPFGKKELLTVTIPWGDVSTAWYTTGIPNIMTYMATSPAMHKQMKRSKYINWLLKTKWMKNALKKRIEKRPAGPDDERRDSTRSLVWGEVRNAKGETIQAKMVGPEGYTITAHMALNIARRALNDHAPKGFQTPAGAYGHELILEMEGVQRELIEL